MLFLETKPPLPFYQKQLVAKQRLYFDKLFIGERSQPYYLKRFASFDAAGKLEPRWHWAAFFMTLPWLLYRKRYLDGLVYAVAGWSFIQLIMAFTLAGFEYVFMGFIPTAWQMPVRFAIAGAIWLAWSAFVAMWADAYYYRVARREISELLDDKRTEDEIIQHLQHEGGVGIIGLLASFALFGFALHVITQQFLPIYANQKQQAILFYVFDEATAVRKQVDAAYHKQQSCPLNLPLRASQAYNTHQVYFNLSTQLAGVSSQADCILTTTVTGVSWPNRQLNKQTLVFYHLPHGHWGCISSLNNKQHPKKCSEL